MANKDRLITLQEVSRRTGATLSSLNYYVNLGLLPVADRQGNKRLFHREKALNRFKEIDRLRREGYPLRMIRRELG